MVNNKKNLFEYLMNNWVFWVWVLYPTSLGLWVLGMSMRAIPIPIPNTHKILCMNVCYINYLIETDHSLINHPSDSHHSPREEIYSE